MRHLILFSIALVIFPLITGKLLAQEQDSAQKTPLKDKILDTSFIDYGAKRYIIIRADPRKNEFIGHWTGIEIGRNELRNSEGQYKVPDQLDFIKLNKKKSWNLNINPVQINIGLFDDHVGLVTGLGLEFSNYRLSRNKTFYYTKTNNRFRTRPNQDSLKITKSKLTTTYLTAPLLLEFQFSDQRRRKRPYLSLGVITGMQLNAHTKLVYEEENLEKKKKDYNYYNLTPFRYGITARLGYRIFDGFINYYLTPLFSSDTKIYPVYAGLRIELKRFF